MSIFSSCVPCLLVQVYSLTDLTSCKNNYESELAMPLKVTRKDTQLDTHQSSYDFSIFKH